MIVVGDPGSPNDLNHHRKSPFQPTSCMTVFFGGLISEDACLAVISALGSPIEYPRCASFLGKDSEIPGRVLPPPRTFPPTGFGHSQTSFSVENDQDQIP